jgi:hypothetical protein
MSPGRFNARRAHAKEFLARMLGALATEKIMPFARAYAKVIVDARIADPRRASFPAGKSTSAFRSAG